MRRLTIAGKSRHCVVVIDQREGEGEVVPRDLLEGPQLARERQPLPTMLLGKLDRVQANGTGSLDRLQRIAPLPLPARGMEPDVFFAKSPGTRHDTTLFAGKDFIQHPLQLHHCTFSATPS